MDREQVLAYRIARQGLHRDDRPVGELDIIDLGVQDTPPGSARVAFAARTESDVDDHDLVWAWSLRASPHLHRAGDLPGLAAALWPNSERDALGRVAWQRSVMQQSGITATEAMRYTAEAMRTAVTAPTGKGAASAAVSKLVPKALVKWCRGCDSEHVFESLFRLAALPAGFRLDLEHSPPVLVPIEDWPGIPDEQHGSPEVIREYLRFVGPASVGDVAAWLTTTQAEVREVWPDALTEVEVGGRTAWLPESEMDLLLDPPEPPSVRLLPPSDPFLQERNRALLVPDKARQKEVWRILGSPGAILVNGEIAGVWRTKASGRKKLEIKVTAFDPPPQDVRADLENEAQRVGAVRGFATTTLVDD